MIRNEKEYQEAKSRLAVDLRFIELQRLQLDLQGLTIDEIQNVIDPLLSFHYQLREEVQWYERIKERDFDCLQNLDGLGQMLIGLRLACGVTQAELARRLGVSDAQVSRDERNEYDGVTIDRVVKILDALKVKLVSQFELTDCKFEYSEQHSELIFGESSKVSASTLAEKLLPDQRDLVSLAYC